MEVYGGKGSESRILKVMGAGKSWKKTSSPFEIFCKRKKAKGKRRESRRKSGAWD